MPRMPRRRTPTPEADQIKPDRPFHGSCRPFPRSAARCAAVATVIACAAPIACESRDGAQVVVYVSADEHVARMVMDAFEDETGVGVLLVGDTEAKKTTGLVERLRRERDVPQADVFWSSEIFQTISLAEEGVLAPHASTITDGRGASHRDAEGRWFAFAARARVIVFAPDRVPPDERPRTWTDLTNAAWRDRIVMADPRFGTTGGHLGAMKAYWDRHAMPGFYEAFLTGLRDNRVRLLPSGNAGVVRAVASGEADVGLTDTDDVWAALAQGLAVDFVVPAHSHEDEPGNGTLLIPNTVALVAGAPHPEAAHRLIDFLLSERVERMLAESTSHNIPLGPHTFVMEERYLVRDPLDVNYRHAAAVRSDAVAAAMKILTDAR